MKTNLIAFLAFFFVALALGAALAHLFELPNKIDLTRAEYLTVQQIYRGWALLGIPIAGALLSTIALAALVRRNRRALTWTAVAIAGLVAAQVVFWVVTFPTNQETRNWTVLPAHWEELRSRWEYSHAVGAALLLVTHAALVLSILTGRPVGDNGRRSWT
jgi:hypothetical protein